MHHSHIRPRGLNIASLPYGLVSCLIPDFSLVLASATWSPLDQGLLTPTQQSQLTMHLAWLSFAPTPTLATVCWMAVSFHLINTVIKQRWCRGTAYCCCGCYNLFWSVHTVHGETTALRCGTEAQVCKHILSVHVSLASFPNIDG